MAVSPITSNSQYTAGVQARQTSRPGSAENQPSEVPKESDKAESPDMQQARDKRFDHYEKGQLPAEELPEGYSPAPEAAPTDPEDGKSPKTEKCTMSTDQVDSEIKRLKEEAQKLEQQLGRTSDERERDSLETRLNSVNSELQAKDNDTYRKQHASVTNG